MSSPGPIIGKTYDPSIHSSRSEERRNNAKQVQLVGLSSAEQLARIYHEPSTAPVVIGKRAVVNLSNAVRSQNEPHLNNKSDLLS